MADILTRKHGSDVFEMSNRATLQTIDAASLPGITARMDNHESGSNPNAHGVQNIGGLQGVLDGKEPVFTKNTAFNKDFGSAIGTVCEGSDSRLSDSRTPLAHTHAITDITNLSTELINKADKSIVTQNIVVVTGVDFVAQTINTTTIKIVDGIIVEII